MIPEKIPYPQVNGSNNTCLEDVDHKRKKPLRFWEIDQLFICPVVGMCLTLSEQKQLLKKAGVSVKHISPFEIHEILVSSSDRESLISRRVDNLLNRKFGKKALTLLGLGHEEFKVYFKNAIETGDCADALWAAAINSELSCGVKKEFFGDIHMSMHWSAEQSVQIKQRLTRKQKEMDDLHRRIKDITQLKRSLEKENRRMRQNHAELKTTLAAAEKEKTRLKEDIASLNKQYDFPQIENENRRLKEELDAIQKNSKDLQCQMVSIKEKNKLLSMELEKQQESNRRYRNEAQEIIREILSLNSCDTTCPSFDLCQKRILIVGGLTRMESLYRELIESKGGIFEYHDGYMKKGVKMLENRLKRADVVVCPVGCNSHAACSIVKNLAKKHNKTVHMLANSSLSAVSQVIWGNTEKGTIN